MTISKISAKWLISDKKQGLHNPWINTYSKNEKSFTWLQELLLCCVLSLKRISFPSSFLLLEEKRPYISKKFIDFKKNPNKQTNKQKMNHKQKNKNIKNPKISNRKANENVKFLKTINFFGFETLASNYTMISFTIATNYRWLTHFMPLISLDTPWKHQKSSGFLMFSGCIKRDQWHEMG